MAFVRRQMRKTTVESVGKSAAILSTVEVGLGSFLHGFHIPFSGKLLSLNQTFLLSWFSKSNPDSDRFFTTKISAITALLKSLSPMGKKLTPMLGISTQGLLFSIGVLLFGNNLWGSLMGSVLAGTWSFLQPLCLYFLIYGGTLITMIEFYIAAATKWFPVSPENLMWAVTFLVIIKLFLHAFLAIFAWKITTDKIEYFIFRLSKLPPIKPLPTKSLTRGLVADLTQPFFVFSLLLTLIFLFFSESSHTQIIWGILRPIAAAFLCFLIIRLLPLEKIKSESLQKALKHLKG